MEVHRVQLIQSNKRKGQPVHLGLPLLLQTGPSVMYMNQSINCCNFVIVHIRVSHNSAAYLHLVFILFRECAHVGQQQCVVLIGGQLANIKIHIEIAL